jgi:hypothetical protein
MYISFFLGWLSPTCFAPLRESRIPSALGGFDPLCKYIFPTGAPVVKMDRIAGKELTYMGNCPWFFCFELTLLGRRGGSCDTVLGGGWDRGGGDWGDNCQGHSTRPAPSAF